MTSLAKVGGSTRTVPIHRHEKVAMGEGLRVVVVADTHGKPHLALRERIARVAPQRILHAGDIGDLAVLDMLGEIAPVTAVRGNIDERLRELPDRVTLDIEHGAGGPSLRLLLLHIAVYGTKLRADVARLAKTEDASIVICGHSHVPFAAHDHGITIFNPGSVGPRRFRLPIVFGVFEVNPRGASLRHIDCETGEAWTPSP